MVGLLHGEAQRTPRDSCHRLDQGQLGVGERIVARLVAVGDELHDTGALLGHRRRDGDQLGLVGAQRADVGAVAGAVDLGAGRGEPDGAGGQPFGDQAGHGGQLGIGRMLEVVGAPVAHHVGAQRGVGHVGPDVDRPVLTVEDIEVCAETTPNPR